MILVKTNELIGASLDWAVAKCEGLALHQDALLDGVLKRGYWVSGLSIDPNCWVPLAMFEPSINWAQGGSISERERISARPVSVPTGTKDKVNLVQGWRSEKFVTKNGPVEMNGESELIAKMRCYVASKLGFEVEVPKILLN